MEVFAPNLIGSESLISAGPVESQLAGAALPTKESPFVADRVAETPAAELPPAQPPAEARKEREPRPKGKFTMPERPPEAVSASSSGTSKMLLLPDLPAVSARVDTRTPAIALRESGILTAPPREAADPFVQVAVAPVAEATRPGLFGKLVGKHPKSTGFIPPTLLRKAATNVPAELRTRIKREVPVDVKVYVDRTGKVEYAELLSDGAHVDRDLASLAVFSSRRWQFTPARVGDETVPGEVVLRFRFGAGQQAQAQ
jgi:hypothetical protein